MKCANKDCNEDAWLVLFMRNEDTGNEFNFNVCPKHYKEIRDMKAWDWIYNIKDAKLHIL